MSAKRYAVRMRFVARRGTARDRTHGVVVLRVSPPEALEGGGRAVSVQRAIHYRLPFEPAGQTADDWARGIRMWLEREAVRDRTAQRLHKEFDEAWHRAFEDFERLAAYHEALGKAVAEGGRSTGPAAKTIERVHEEMLAGLLGEAGDAEVEYWVEEIEPAEEAAAAPAAPAQGAEAAASAPSVRPGAVASPWGDLPEISLHPVPFKGKAAIELRRGEVIVPERNRARPWEVLDVRTVSGEAETIAIRCRLAGPLAEVEGAAEGVVLATSSIRVPLAREYGIVVGTPEVEIPRSRLGRTTVLALVGGVTLLLWILFRLAEGP